MAVLGDGPSLLVMPFNNIGHDPTQDYFAAGLAEDLAVDLARIPGLTIASPDAVDRRRALGPAADAARELGARVVLSGSVRLEGRRLRVTVRLIDAGNSGILWTDRYERSQTDVLSLQSEISGAVAQALKVKLLETELVHGLSAGTTDEGAQLFYLKARSFHLRGADARSLEIARVLYLRAIERDPNFARALAQLAICESHLAMGKNTFDDADAELCMSHAQQALHLDPHLAEAHAGRGLAHYGAGDYDAASEALDVAVSLNPMLYEACFFQGRNRRLQGRRREAADFFERAAALRTGDYRSMGLLGEELQALGRHQDAGGAFADCLGRLEAEVDSHPQNADALAFGAAVLVDLGRPEQAAEWASWALLLGEGQRLVHYNVARTWALLQRRDAALDELERAFKAAPVVQRRLALWMANDEDLRSLANEARYRQLLDSRTATL